MKRFERILRKDLVMTQCQIFKGVLLHENTDCNRGQKDVMLFC